MDKYDEISFIYFVIIIPLMIAGTQIQKSCYKERTEGNFLVISIIYYICISTFADYKLFSIISSAATYYFFKYISYSMYPVSEEDRNPVEPKEDFATRNEAEKVANKNLPNGTEMNFDYVDAGGNVTNRSAIVIKIKQIPENDFIYIYSYCLLRQEMRSFRVDRMQNVINLSTGEVFETQQELIEYIEEGGTVRKKAVNETVGEGNDSNISKAFEEMRIIEQVRFINIPEEVPVKSIRNHFRMNKESFCSTFGISMATLISWEVNEKTPPEFARAFLKVLEHSPETVIEAMKK